MVVSLSTFSFFESCIYDSVDPEAAAPSEPYYVQFRLEPGKTSGTRAVDDDTFDGENHPSEPGIAAESYISFSDMRIFLFNGADGIFLEELRPQPTLNDPTTFTAQLTVRPEFLEDKSGNISLTIMVLANWESITPDSYRSVLPGTVNNMETKGGYTFERKNDWNPEDRVRGIPMYGRQEFKGITKSLLESSSKDAPLLLYSDGSSKTDYQKDIKLLRSLAKFEIADAIQGKDANGFPKIISLNLLNYRSNGLFIPKPESFGGQYNQVNNVSLPSGETVGQTLKLNKGPGYNTTEDGYGSDWDSKFTDGWWTTYLPEMLYTPSESNFKIQATVQYSSDPQNTGILEAPMPGFNIDGTTLKGMILRNHIYRLEIGLQEVPQNTVLTLKYGICPWVEETINIPPFD